MSLLMGIIMAAIARRNRINARMKECADYITCRLLSKVKSDCRLNTNHF